MALYRVDCRHFSEGDIIRCNPSSYYESTSFAQNKRDIEDLLNRKRRNSQMPVRNECLYIFTALSDAVSFWIKMKDSSIYEVKKCSDTTKYFRGDMNITDFMLNTTDLAVLEALASQYWEPIYTFKACIEILVDKVEVVTKLTLDENQRKKTYNEYSTHLKIESLNFYRNTLTKQSII